MVLLLIVFILDRGLILKILTVPFIIYSDQYIFTKCLNAKLFLKLTYRVIVIQRKLIIIHDNIIFLFKVLAQPLHVFDVFFIPQIPELTNGHLITNFICLFELWDRFFCLFIVFAIYTNVLF